WFFGVVIPFTLAQSKTPSATMLACPAGFLLFGMLVSRAVRGDIVSALAWVAATALAVFATGDLQLKAMGYSSPPAWRAHAWAIAHIAVALVVAGIGGLFLRRL